MISMTKKLIFCFVSFALLFFLKGEAGVLDHLKPAQNKSNIHKMKNIDFIYMINLDQRPEKFESSLAQLKPYGIIPYRFSAVNGWELTREIINDVGVKFSPEMTGGYWATTYPLDSSRHVEHEHVKNFGQVYFCHCLAPGAIGCVLSHLSCLKDGYDSGYSTIWVMEDDIKVIKDPRILSDLIEKLDRKLGKNAWDILFTDRDMKDAYGKDLPSEGMARRPNFNPNDLTRFYVKKDIDQNFRKIGSRFGATSMIIRRSGMKKLLDFYKKYQLYHPYDMDYYLPEGIQVYTVREDVVTNIPGAISDNGGPNYLNKKNQD